MIIGNKVENYIPKNEKIKYLYVTAKIFFAVLLSLCKTEKMMIKSKFYKQNGDEFSGLSAVLSKKKDLEGKILQGLFSEKSYAILAKRGLHRNIE